MHSRHPIPFSKEQSGECVQVDMKAVKVAGQKCFQYTALNDCTRYRVLHLYLHTYHDTSLDLLATVRQALPFPIRKAQVENGTEFPLAFALAVQEPASAFGISSRASPNRTGRWNAAIASTMRSFGVAPHVTSSREQLRPYAPGSIGTIMTDFPCPPEPNTCRKVVDSALALGTISTIHAHGGHCLTTHYTQLIQEFTSSAAV